MHPLPSLQAWVLHSCDTNRSFVCCLHKRLIHHVSPKWGGKGGPSDHLWIHCGKTWSPFYHGPSCTCVEHNVVQTTWQIPSDMPLHPPSHGHQCTFHFFFFPYRHPNFLNYSWPMHSDIFVCWIPVMWSCSWMSGLATMSTISRALMKPCFACSDRSNRIWDAMSSSPKIMEQVQW